MKLRHLLSATAALCAIANGYGWPSTLFAGIVVYALAALIDSRERTRRILAANVHEVAGSRAHKIADLFIAVSAAIRSDGVARGVALEAQSTLDELARDGVSGVRLVREALRHVMAMRSQLKARRLSGSRTPDFLQEEEEEEVLSSETQEPSSVAFVGSALPEGIDDEEYKRIRRLMSVSVLNTWRTNQEVIAGLDPWDVVDEAWSSMAERNFESTGPFLPHALTVARNKAVEALRRGEATRRDRSMDAPLPKEPADAAGADVEYFLGLDQMAAVHRLSLAEEAIYSPNVLTDVERDVFLAVRVDGKSRAEVGQELSLTGQRIGQIAAEAFLKLQDYVKGREGDPPTAT